MLFEEVLDNILHNHNDTRPFDIMTEVESANACSILQTLVEPCRRRAFNTSDTHEFSSIHLRDSTIVTERTVIFKNNGLPANSSDIKDVTIESEYSLFCFRLDMVSMMVSFDLGTTLGCEPIHYSLYTHYTNLTYS